MASLRAKLAEHGFVSNEDYEYPVRCLLSAGLEHLRTLNLEGGPGRRKTAFAYALGHALDYAHVLYHEFDDRPEPAEPVRIPPPPQDDEPPPGLPPVEALDRVVSEACALSEGERTMLILDQLQLAPFRQHLRLAEFVRSHLWSYGGITLKAHPQHLLLVLISEEPLYHSLQQLTFKLWVDSGRPPEQPVTPAALGLPEHARGMLTALGEIFAALEVSPTPGEYARVVHDIHVNIQRLDQLKTSIYGWVEGVDRRRLLSEAMHTVFERHWPTIADYLRTAAESVEEIVPAPPPRP